MGTRPNAHPLDPGLGSSNHFRKLTPPHTYLLVTRARPGGGYPPLPSGFSWIAKKRRRVARSNFAKLFKQHFDTLPASFQVLTSWPQRSRLQVTLSDPTSSCIFQSLRACQRHIKDPNSLKLAVCNTDIGIYDFYVSDFFISVTSGHVNFMTSPL